MTLTVCWSAKGGSGTTVVAAALALGSAIDSLLIDLDGELPAALGVPEPSGQGLSDWFASDAPERVGPRPRRRRSADARRLVARGPSAIPRESPRWPALRVVPRHHAARRRRRRRLRRAARRRCSTSGSAACSSPGRATSRCRAPAGCRGPTASCSSPSRAQPDRRRCRRAVGAPVVARIAVDPAIARAVDAGLLAARLPRCDGQVAAAAPGRRMTPPVDPRSTTTVDERLVAALCRAAQGEPGQRRGGRARARPPPRPARRRGRTGTTRRRRRRPPRRPRPARRAGPRRRRRRGARQRRRRDLGRARRSARTTRPDRRRRPRRRDRADPRAARPAPRPHDADRRRPPRRRHAGLRRRAADQRRRDVPVAAALPRRAAAADRVRRRGGRRRARRARRRGAATGDLRERRRRARRRCCRACSGSSDPASASCCSRTPPSSPRWPTTSCAWRPARRATTALPAISVEQLLHTALRLRPDRLVVGEVRGAEVLGLVQALNTGHDGSWSTCHANSALDALHRLETLVVQAAPAWPLRAVRDHLVRCIDVVVHVERTAGGGAPRRRDRRGDRPRRRCRRRDRSSSAASVSAQFRRSRAPDAR